MDTAFVRISLNTERTLSWWRVKNFTWLFKAEYISGDSRDRLRVSCGFKKHFPVLLSLFPVRILAGLPTSYNGSRQMVRWVCWVTIICTAGSTTTHKLSSKCLQPTVLFLIRERELDFHFSKIYGYTLKPLAHVDVKATLNLITMQTWAHLSSPGFPSFGSLCFQIDFYVTVILHCLASSLW